MIVLVEEEGSREYLAQGRRFRPAPPVATNIGGKEWGASRSRERKHLNAYDKENERRPGHTTPRTHDPYDITTKRPIASRTHSGRSDRTASGREREHEREGMDSAYGHRRHENLPSAGGQSIDASEFSFGIPEISRDPRGADPRRRIH